MVGLSRCAIPPLQGSWPVRSGAVLRVTRPEALTKAATQCAARHLPAVHGPSPDALAACALALLGPSPWPSRALRRPHMCIARYIPPWSHHKSSPRRMHYRPVGTPRRMHSARHQARHSACRDSSPHQQNSTCDGSSRMPRTVQQIRSSERGTSVCRVTHGRCRFVSFQ